VQRNETRPFRVETCMGGFPVGRSNKTCWCFLKLCTDDDNRSYRNVCNMSFVSFALAV